jgi:hypothetical protein
MADREYVGTIDLVEKKKVPVIKQHLINDISLDGYAPIGHTVYTPASITEIALDTSAGTVAGVQTMCDGAIYQVEETTGVPGFSISFNFSGVTKIPQWLVYRAAYNGSATHWVLVYLYNFVTATHVALDMIPHTSEYYIVKSIYLGMDLTNYMSSGAMAVLFYHITSGNSAHTMYFDYIGLVSEK